MDVQCERCKTEYEFDDALVSGRGTTVRCTNCGHQFKVRKQEISTPGADADRWTVRTEGGQDLVFLTLRDLQRAILAKQVGRSDVLRRGHALPRLLGTIAELDPFFEGRTSSHPPPPWGEPPPRIPGPSIAPRIAEPTPTFPKRTASWGVALDAHSTPPSNVAMPRPKADTLRPDGMSGAAPPPRSPSIATLPPLGSFAPEGDAHSQAGTSAPRDVHDAATQRYPLPEAAPDLEMSSPLPPPTAPVRRRPSFPEEEPADPSRPSPWSENDDYPSHRRRKVGGWIVAVVLMMAVGVVGWVVAKPYLKLRGAVAAATVDPRAQAFVNDGERAISEGNLDAAQEAFDKASALAEHDSRVLIDEARVAAAKADVPWLKTKLLPSDAKDDAKATRADLIDRVARARKSADAALAAAPDDAGALRAHVDALRLSGERDLARREVSRILAQASQPETAYVLAALDLSEAEPLWTTLIDRLRLAASGEGNAGRARAALVYVLAQSGDVASAKAELVKLEALPRTHPLSPALHAFVDRNAPKASLPAQAEPPRDKGLASSARVDTSSPPPTRSTVGGGAAPTDGDEGSPVGETAGGMKAAQAAIHKGDWNRARSIYAALVARNPNDSEALAGLGDVARAQGDLAGALAAYRKVLAVNPSYLPALLGVADTQWAMGDRGGSQRSYKDIVDRFPEGTYPAYVKSRSEPPSVPVPTASAAGVSIVPATAAPVPSSSPPAAHTDGL